MSNQITISDDAKAAVEQFAKDKNVSLNEAASSLIGTGVSRLNALRRYAKKQAAVEEMPQAKKNRKKKAEAKEANGAVKGPLARKMASTAKAPRVRKKAAVDAPSSVQ